MKLTPPPSASQRSGQLCRSGSGDTADDLDRRRHRGLGDGVDSGHVGVDTIRARDERGEEEEEIHDGRKISVEDVLLGLRSDGPKGKRERERGDLVTI